MSIPVSKHLMTKIHEDDLMRVTSNVIHNEVCDVRVRDLYKI